MSKQLQLAQRDGLWSAVIYIQICSFIRRQSISVIRQKS